MTERKTNINFTFIEFGIVALVLAGLALLVVPSLMRKIKERRTAEATENVRELFNASAEYFAAQLADPNVDRNSISFPATTDFYPAEIGKKATRSVDWHTIEAFTTLGFSIDEPHYYQYRYESEGRGANARFVVIARGDLDGDGKYSRFEMEGYIEDWEVRGDTTVVDQLE